MITMGFFIQQFIFGLTISAVDAPALILCIKKTLRQGFGPGLWVGLGTSAAYVIDGLLGSLEVVKSIISDAGASYIAIIGGIFLFWFAIMTFKTHPLLAFRQKSSDESCFKTFISAFFFTIANPVVILLFIIFYTNVEKSRLDIQYDLLASTLLAVFLGAGSWWFVLSGILEKTRGRLSIKILSNINQIVGIFLIAFGCCAFFEAYHYV